MRQAFFLIFCFTAAGAADEGELRFRVANTEYATSQAQGLIKEGKAKTRILIAVKDNAAKFLLVLTADVAPGSEKSPITLTTEDAELSVSLRTLQGSLAVMPAVQLARLDPNLTYTERSEVATGTMEEMHGRKRPKMRSEYRRVKPAWHTQSRAARLESGAGVIGNRAFRNTFFTLRLEPVVTGGKVVAFTGSFSGTGRFARSITGGEVKPIANGTFHVRVEHAP